MIKKEINSLKWSAIYQILTSAVSYLTLIVLARKYDPIYYGILIFGFNLLEFLKILSDPGLTLYNISIFSHVPDKERFISEVFYIRFILSTFAFIIFLIALFLYPTSSELKIVMFVFSLSLFPNIFDSRWIFQGSLKMNLSFFSRTVFRLLFFALILIIFYKNMPYYYIPYLFFIAAFLGYSVSFPLILKYYGNFKITFHPSVRIISYLKSATPIGINQMLMTFNGITAIFLIGYLMRSGDVGQYGAAYKYSLFVSGILSIILNSLLPIISKNKLNEKRFNRYSQFYLDILILSIFSVTIPILIYNNIIYRFIYGSKYIRSANLASLLILANLVYSYVHFIGFHLISKNEQAKYTRILSLGFITNLFFIIILIPRYGIYGAGIAMLIGSLVSLFLTMYYNNKFIKTYSFESLKTIFALLFSFIITLIIHILAGGFLGFFIAIPVVISFNLLIIRYFQRRVNA